MAYFRQPKKKKEGDSVDGFVSRNSSNYGARDINRAYTSYSPNPKAIDRVSERTVDYTPRRRINVNEGLVGSYKQNEVKTIENQFETQEKTKKDKNKKSLFSKNTKKKSRKKQGRVKKTAKVFAMLFVALLIGVSSLFAYGYIKSRNIFKGDGEGAAALQKDVDPARLNGEGDGRVNILLIGKGGPGHEAPDLTDTLLLASIDPVQNEASLVSVPRDLYVKNASGYSMKINAIYSTAKQARLARSDNNDSDKQAAENAGLDAIKDSVSDVLGVPVHYYVMVDFKAFEDAINTVGGITVDVKEPLYDQSVAWLLNGNPLVADKGLQTMDGKRALLYARSRKGSARGDFDRTERQREIIVALQKKIFSLGTFSNPFKVVDLLGTFGDRVRTDLNGINEIKRLYEIGQQIGADRIGSIGLADPPNILVNTDMIGGQSVVVPTAGLYQYDEIHSYIRNNLRDAFLKSEDARVLILNGTSIAGLATSTSKELKSYGYNVIGVDNAPTNNYIQNQLIDLTNGSKKYTKSYLEKRLKLTATTAVPEGVPGIETADFVIILGTDEATQTTN